MSDLHLCEIPRFARSDKLQSRDGLLLFAKYAFMPNRLGYCGGDVHGVFETCAALARRHPPGTSSVEGDDMRGETLHDVRAWALQFEGAYPYLKLIASANHIADPFDARVVEAYWVGNVLLQNASLAPLYDSLRERFAARVSAKNLDLILGQVPHGAQPFHAFHVFDVCRRTGALAENLHTLDSCRISWGQVQSVFDGSLNVAVQPIVFETYPERGANRKLVLGTPQLRTVTRQVNGRGFVNDVGVGDWVSIHWNWACDVLTPRQLSHLQQHTHHALAVANLVL